MKCVWVTILWAVILSIGCDGCEDIPPEPDNNDMAAISDAGADMTEDVPNNPDVGADTTNVLADMSDDLSIDVGQDMGPPPFDDVDQAIVAWFERYCDVVFSCPGRLDFDDELAMHLRRFSDVAACRAQAPVLASTLEEFVELPGAVSDDRRAFDPFEAEREIEGLEERICRSDGRTRFGRLSFPEQQDLGEPCVMPLECELFDSCVKQPGECHGVCTESTVNNCGNDRCRSDEYCAQDICVPAKDNGEACANFRECGPSLTCNNNICVSVLSVDVGQVCTSGVACIETAYCDINAGICAAKVPTGQPCTSTGECDDGYCDLNNLCADLFSVPLGGACDDSLFCDLDTICDENASTCVEAVLANGATCSGLPDQPRCDLGLMCQDIDFVSGLGTCEPLRAAGQACIISYQCALDLQCDANSNTCVPLGNDGTACWWDFDCVSGRCENDLCVETLACVIP